VEEYHVDGFRFDLASVMCRDELGRPLDSPPIVREIAKDPVLSQACTRPHRPTNRQTRRLCVAVTYVRMSSSRKTSQRPPMPFDMHVYIIRCLPGAEC
jgi:hypothetical protein